MKLRKNGAKIFGMFAGVSTTVYLISGSNSHHPPLQLQFALQEIEANIAAVEQVSAVYKTQAWGNTNQAAFYNQVIRITTQKKPEILLKELLDLENKMGRVRKVKWEPRIIDLDILYFGRQIIAKPLLKVPHPFLHERRFTLEPLQEIAPNFIHPFFNVSNKVLLAQCKDTLEVEKLP